MAMKFAIPLGSGAVGWFIITEFQRNMLSSFSEEKSRLKSSSDTEKAGTRLWEDRRVRTWMREGGYVCK
jgi:hypothetical protein